MPIFFSIQSHEMHFPLLKFKCVIKIIFHDIGYRITLNRSCMDMLILTWLPLLSYTRSFMLHFSYHFRLHFGADSSIAWLIKQICVWCGTTLPKFRELVLTSNILTYSGIIICNSRPQIFAILIVGHLY